MTDQDGDRGDREPRAMIYEIRRRVQAARNRYWAEGVDAEISDATHRELAIATLQYHDVLNEFRTEDIFDDGLPDISPIRSRVGRKSRRLESSAGLGRGGTVETVPAVTEVPIEQVLEMSEELDDAASELGFGAHASPNTTHRTEIDDELLEEVEAWRQQNLEN